MKLLETCATLAIFALPALAQAAAPDALAIVNAVRRQGCNAAGAATPLTTDARLDRAAQAIARGQTLRQAILDAGYRAVQSVVIQLEGAAKDEELRRLIVRGFCSEVVQPGLRHAGIHRQKHNDAYAYWIVLAAPFTVPALDADATARRLLALVNEARASSRACGNKAFAPAPSLRRSTLLDQAARAHARDMAARQVLSHTGGDGSRARDRVERVGYAWQALGENVAAGHRNAEDALASWLRSPGHCANVMNAEFTEMGTGVATNAASEEGVFWVQVFGAPQ